MGESYANGKTFSTELPLQHFVSLQFFFFNLIRLVLKCAIFMHVQLFNLIFLQTFSQAKSKSKMTQRPTGY